MDLAFFIALLTAIVSSGVLVLTVVAPKTKTDKDDKVLEKLVQLEDLIKSK